LELAPLNLGSLELGPLSAGQTYTDMQVSGNYAYVAAGTAGVKIVNVSNGLAPELVRTYGLPNARTVAVGSSRLCVGAGQTLFAASLETSAASPDNMGSVTLSGAVNGIVIGNNHAFVALAGFGQGFAVVDLGTTPPQVVGGKVLSGFAVDVAWRGGYLFVVTSAPERLHVFSVTTPSNPQLRSSANLLSNVDPETVTVAGSVVYVSTQNSLTAVSLADLDNPVPLPATFLGSGSYYAGASIGAGLWASPTNEGTLLFDLAQPLAPERAAYAWARQYAGDSFPGTVTGTGFTPDGELVTVLNGGRVQIVKVDRPSLIPAASRLDDAGDPERVEAGRYGTPVFPRYRCLAAHRLYSAAGTPTYFSILGGGAPPRSMTIFGATVYACDETPALRVYDITDSDTPALLAERQLIGGVSSLEDIAVVSTTAVAVNIDPGRIFVLNVANPALPALTGTLNIPAADRAHVRISGDVAWIVAGRDNALSLQAFDISNPAAPVPRGSVPLQTTTSVLGNDFEIVGSRAYVAGSHAGLIVCDISNPDAPVVRSTTPLPPFIVDVTVLGDYAYVASTAAGLQVVDISDPAQPRWVASNSAYHTRSVANAGGFVFAGGYHDGLITFPAYDPPAGRYAYLLHIQDVTASNVTLRATGPANESMVVDWTADGVTWQPWHLATTNSLGTTSFTKTRPAPLRALFRLRY